MKKTLLLFFFSSASLITSAQGFYTQYFDGADTSASNSIFILRDTSAGNVWQIGAPQKIIFNRASTVPNALVTDTLNNYPPNNTSSFIFQFPLQPFFFNIIAIQWMQKLDFDSADGGIIEYSIDHGNSWMNIAGDPHVYNFYGFQNPQNFDTIFTGESGFTKRDTSWKNIWLCFDGWYLSSVTDTAYFRFTMKSDSIDNGNEGWMIDNIWAAETIIHTIKKNELTDYVRIFPSPTNGIINIETKKLTEDHVIEQMTLTNMKGQVVKQYSLSQAKYTIDISDQLSGQYYLKIKTNKATNTFKVVLNK